MFKSHISRLWHTNDTNGTQDKGVLKTRSVPCIVPDNALHTPQHTRFEKYNDKIIWLEDTVDTKY